MDTEVIYCVVRAMGWLGLEVGGTVTLTMTDDSITCDPPHISAIELHSALQLGYIVADCDTATAILSQPEAAKWIESLALMCMPPHKQETDRELRVRLHSNSRRVAGMMYGAGGCVIGPHSPETPRNLHLRLVG